MSHVTLAQGGAARIEHGTASLLLGQLEDALAVFDTALALFPGDAHILKLRAEAAAKEGSTGQPR